MNISDLPKDYISSKLRILDYIKEDKKVFGHLLTYTQSAILVQMAKHILEIQEYRQHNPRVWRTVLQTYYKTDEEETLTPFEVDCNYSCKAYFRNWKTFEKIQHEVKAFDYW